MELFEWQDSFQVSHVLRYRKGCFVHSLWYCVTTKPKKLLSLSSTVGRDAENSLLHLRSGGCAVVSCSLLQTIQNFTQWPDDSAAVLCKSNKTKVAWGQNTLTQHTATHNKHFGQWTRYWCKWANCSLTINLQSNSNPSYHSLFSFWIRSKSLLIWSIYGLTLESSLLIIVAK